MPPIGQVCVEPNITVEVINRFGAVDSFVYLGSTLSRNSSLDAGISSRIAKVSTAFGKLEKCVWSDRGTTTNTKLSVYYMRLVSLQLVIIYIYMDLKHGQLAGIMLTYSRCIIRTLHSQNPKHRVEIVHTGHRCPCEGSSGVARRGGCSVLPQVHRR